MILDQPAFEVDGQPLSIGMALAIGRAGKILVPIEQALREGLSAQDYTSENEELELSKAELQEAVNAWRRKSDLISGDAAKEWLEAHQLELDDLVAHLERQLLRAKLADRLSEVSERHPADPELLAELLPEEVVLGGLLEPLIHRVALRAAAELIADAQQLRAAIADLRAELGESALASFGLDDAELQVVLRIEANYRLKRKELVDRETIERELRKTERNLVQIEFVTATFDSEEAAHEAVCCVREDKKWLEPLGAAMGFETRRSLRYVEDLPEGAVTAMLSAGRPGDCFGPAEAGRRWEVFEVLGRIEPDLEDAALRERIEDRVLTRILGSAVERRVRFRYLATTAAPR